MLLNRDDPPRVEILPLACQAGEAAGRWRCAWEVVNLGPRELLIEAAWLPHGRFRAETVSYAPPRRLAPRARTRLEGVVSSAGTAGEVVENAFLILRVCWGEAAWRVLARLTITYDARAHPVQTLALLTAQPMGFAT